MKNQALASGATLTREEEAPAGARRVLIVDGDSQSLRLITEMLRSDPLLSEPVGVGSAEAALRLLATGERVDCLLADLVLPGMDGLRLLHAAEEMRPDLKSVLMASKPTDDLHRAVLESGATRLLAKPLDFEDLLASVAKDRPGALSLLEGDLGLLDVCWLSAACQVDGGLRIWHDGGEGIVAHRGAKVIHAAAGSLAGTAALDSLLARRSWRFESLSALRTAGLEKNCELEVAADGRNGAGAAGSLRGLTLRHL
ncbi:MAG TPA: response regulator, partial [Thermoanaerobaculia bacterium]|nr:response regulator [Thermoanaerobaculia bacterium]